MSLIDKVLELVQKAFDEFDSPNYRLSNVIRKGIRIARLRSDYDSLLWLEEEMLSQEDNEVRIIIQREIQPHYSKNEFNVLQTHLCEVYVDERRFRLDKSGNLVQEESEICALSVPDIEDHIDFFENEAAATITPKRLLDPVKLQLTEQARYKSPYSPPKSLYPPTTYSVERSYSEKRSKLRRIATEYRNIIRRIEHRVHEFLSATEKQLIYGQINFDIFEKNRQFVDAKLHLIAPEALAQFIAAFRRLNEGDSEARSHALLSCRRILKSIADKLYPPREEPVIGSDGKKREMTEDKYINRLWQFVADKLKGTTGNLLIAQTKDIGYRIDCVYNSASKGVHTDVSEFEVNQCVIQTYLLIGDLLRLADQESAMYSE